MAEEEENGVHRLSKAPGFLSGDVWPATAGAARSFDDWLANVRRNPIHSLYNPSRYMNPLHRRLGSDSAESDNHSGKFQPSDQQSEISLWKRLGDAAILDIESKEFSWDALSSLHATKHTCSPEYSEDEFTKPLEVTVNSGGIVFYALFDAVKMCNSSAKEAAAVIKISSSRMATQSERLGYGFAKWLGVRTPQARVIHNCSIEWLQIKVAAEKVRDVAVSAGDEVGKITCTEFLEALELSRCLFLMSYVHGSPLLERSDAFDSHEAAQSTAASLGMVLMLDLILRNEDRLPCRQLGWRGNPANLLLADKLVSTRLGTSDSALESAPKSYKPREVKTILKERRSHSDGKLGLPRPDVAIPMSDSFRESTLMDTEDRASDENNFFGVCIVAIDSGIPRRPPAGKRAKDQEQYPKVVELMLNNCDFAGNMLYEISGGKLGFHISGDVPLADSGSSTFDTNMEAVIHEFQEGFRSALTDLQGFHIFLLTLHQKLDCMLRLFVEIIDKNSGESDKDDSWSSGSPSYPSTCGLTPLPVTLTHKELIGNVTDTDLIDLELQKSTVKSLTPPYRESSDAVSPFSRDNWNGRCSHGSGDPARNLRLTMKLRDFNKCTKIDADLCKELEQWNDMVRNDVIKLCQENNFNTGFLEGSDCNIVVELVSNP